MLNSVHFNLDDLITFNEINLVLYFKWVDLFNRLFHIKVTWHQRRCWWFWSIEVFFLIQSGILFCFTVCKIMFCIEIHWKKEIQFRFVWNMETWNKGLSKKILTTVHQKPSKKTIVARAFMWQTKKRIRPGRV